MTWSRAELLALRDDDAPPTSLRVVVERDEVEQPTAWRDRAACRGKPMQWWYPERFDAAPGAIGKSICRACPVRAECLADALETEEHERYRSGIRGGLTPGARGQLHHRESKGQRAMSAVVACADEVDVNREYVRMARMIAVNTPGAVAAVLAGTVSLRAAYDDLKGVGTPDDQWAAAQPGCAQTDCS